MSKVVIIGGGLAGISAAVSLLTGDNSNGTPHGQNTPQVTLIDQRSFLGGRCYSYNKPDAPELDNGHHVTLGCYRNLRQLLATIGTTTPIDFQKHLQLHYRGNDQQRPVIDSLETVPLVAPLNLLVGLLRLKSFSLRDKWLACKIGPAVKNRQAINVEQTATVWLQAHQQSPRLIQWLWEPLCSAALNRHPDQASARLFAEVLHEAFFINASDAAIGVFNDNLLSIVGNPARHYLENKGCRLLLGRTAEGFTVSGDRLTGVRLDDGSELTADIYISAVPQHRLSALLPEKIFQQWPAAKTFAEIQSSPIVNVYLAYARAPFDLPFCCLLGGTMQWVFDVSHLLTAEQKAQMHLVSFTVSDARQLLETPNDQLAQLAHQEMRAAFPESCPETFLKSWVIKERRATMDHSPAQEKLRPSPVTPFANLYLAGDWTATNLPCTLEGACASGFRVAEMLTNSKR